jgi:hypothetical protein
MSLTASDIIIIVVATIITLIIIVLVIMEAEKQMYMYGLRPSESTSTDIAGLMTLTRGLPGDIENIVYGNNTKNIFYNITIRDKIVCVSSVARYTTTDCSSAALDISSQRISDLTIKDAIGFKFEIDKNGRDIGVSLIKTGGI